MAKPVVAIVGRPNVGKSTFFNKVVGKRIAIVEDTPGVTRDRLYFEVEWCGRKMMMIDTGGIEPDTNDAMMTHIKTQAELAIEHADVILFLTDIRAGVTADDREIASMLRKRLARRRPKFTNSMNWDSTSRMPSARYTAPERATFSKRSVSCYLKKSNPKRMTIP